MNKYIVVYINNLVVSTELVRAKIPVLFRINQNIGEIKLKQLEKLDILYQPINATINFAFNVINLSEYLEETVDSSFIEERGYPIFLLKKGNKIYWSTNAISAFPFYITINDKDNIIIKEFDSDDDAKLWFELEYRL